MNYQNLQNRKGLKCFKALQIIQTQMTLQCGHDCLRNIDHHKRRELFRKGKRDLNAGHCYRRIDRVDCFVQTASDTLKQQLENDSGNWALERLLNSYSARLNVASSGISTNFLRNQPVCVS